MIAFRIADRRAGVALGGAEIKEIRSGTGFQLIEVVSMKAYLEKRARNRLVGLLLPGANR